MSTLAGRTVALSISDAPDRARLGFPAREIERALFTLCTALIRAGARIQYAGDLRPDGWTFKLFHHLAGAYAGLGEAPFLHVIPEPVLRRSSFDALVAAARESKGTAEAMVVIGGRLRPLWASGSGLLVDPQGSRDSLPDAVALAAWLGGFPEEPRAEGFSLARRLATSSAAARVAMGGKMGLLDVPTDLYEGALPGIAEEAILTLEAGAAFVPLGAYGGVTRDVAIALDLLQVTRRVPRGRQTDSYEVAMRQLEALRPKIPPKLHKSLSEIAGSDRAEWSARRVVELIETWPTIGHA